MGLCQGYEEPPQTSGLVRRGVKRFLRLAGSNGCRPRPLEAEDRLITLAELQQAPTSVSCPRGTVGLSRPLPGSARSSTGGDDIGDTFVQAADCLAEAIAGRIARGYEIPSPSKPKAGQHVISVPPLYLAPKLALYLAVRERRIPNTELARRLRVSETVVRRMLNPKHDTKPEKIQVQG